MSTPWTQPRVVTLLNLQYGLTGDRSNRGHTGVSTATGPTQPGVVTLLDLLFVVVCWGFRARRLQRSICAHNISLLCLVVKFQPPRFPVPADRAQVSDVMGHRGT